MTSLELIKALEFGGHKPQRADDVVLVNGLPPTAEMLAAAPDWLKKAQQADHAATLLTRAQDTKNASLGFTPEQMAETLKVQVNLGIGGLLAMIQRDRAVFSALLMSKGICTQLELDAAFAAPSLAAVNALIAQRLTYWQWIAQVDAEAQACIADPTRTPSFPAPPQLS